MTIDNSVNPMFASQKMTLLNGLNQILDSMEKHSTTLLAEVKYLKAERDQSKERIAELEARVVTLVRDLARSEVSASLRFGNCERAEKRAEEAVAQRDKLRKACHALASHCESIKTLGYIPDETVLWRLIDKAKEALDD